jgi:acetyltransferase
MSTIIKSPASAEYVAAPHATPAQRTFAMGARPLSIDALFSPRNVAVIGASEKLGAGRTAMLNLTSGTFRGEVFAVNPKHEILFGKPAYPAIGDIPKDVDLAIIATPAATVPDIISECAEAGVKVAIVLAAGFKEAGPEGARLEREIAKRAAGRMRVLGPNSTGIMVPSTGLNATLSNRPTRSGSIGFASQSGAVGTAILDWSVAKGIGLSAFVSMGSLLDVRWSDVIYHFGDDPATHAIVLCMESIGDARRFLSAAREVALSKPIIVIKGGRTAAGARTAASHSGILAGSDKALDAAFARCGVLRIDSIEDLFIITEVLAKQPRPLGKRLAIVTNAGGPAVLACDALIQGGGELASIAPAALAKLEALLPAHWNRANPIELDDNAPLERIGEAIKIAIADQSNDAILVAIAPQALAATPQEAAECIKAMAKTSYKPLLVAWMGLSTLPAAAEILEPAGIPTLAYPDYAAHIFDLMWRHDANLRALFETPRVSPDCQAPNRAAVRKLFTAALSDGRELLSEAESKQLLAAYDIPTTQTIVATTPEAAVAAALSIGFPVVVKVNSETISHKSDVGGVRLNLRSAPGVALAFDEIHAAVVEHAGAEAFQGVSVQPMIDTQDGYELILGASCDPQFGPVILFGSGGQLVEVYNDTTLALPPLNESLARQTIARTKLAKAFAGVRGRKPIDVGALAQLLVRFSEMILEQPRIKEIDINPLVASPSGFVALDCRVVLHPASIPDAALPSPSIRPYPQQYVDTWTARSGLKVAIRPIRPEDEPLMAPFHATLSEDTVYHRYAHMLPLQQRLSHERLSRLCFIDYSRQIALLALKTNDAGKEEIVGIGRLIMESETNQAEFAILVGDSFQRQGLGKELLRRLVEIAKAEGVDRVIGYILNDNRGMLAVCSSLGFRHKLRLGDELVHSVIQISRS